MKKNKLGIVKLLMPVLWLTLLSGCFSTAEESPKPNIIVIFTDDQGYEDVGVFGGDHVFTPNLDKMAANGLLLTDFYVAAPLCSPSRAALMTGSYPRRINMATGSKFPVLLASDSKGLNPDELTIAEVMKQQGYVTGMFGKWHLGDQPEFMPTRQGFDEFFGLPYSHDIAPTHRRQADFNFPDLPLLEGEDVIELNPNPEQLTRRITNKVVNFIEQHQDEPFFIYVPHPMPHGPWHVSDEFMQSAAKQQQAELGFNDNDLNNRKKSAMYPLVVGELDQSVGYILDTLKTLALDSNTIVIFTSDNGPIGKRNVDGTKRFLAGHKTKTQEGGMRVPTIVWGPGNIPKGAVSNEITTAMDIFPTISKLAGAELPNDRVIDGKDIWPILNGEPGAKSPHEAFYYYSENTIEAVRQGNWKLAIKGDTPGLYNMRQDPSEKVDVSDEFPQRVIELKQLIAQFEKSLDIGEDGYCGNCRPAAFVNNPQPLTMPLK
jgi:arylsulfatase A